MVTELLLHHSMLEWIESFFSDLCTFCECCFSESDVTSLPLTKLSSSFHYLCLGTTKLWETFSSLPRLLTSLSSCVLSIIIVIIILLLLLFYLVTELLLHHYMLEWIESFSSDLCTFYLEAPFFETFKLVIFETGKTPKVRGNFNLRTDVYSPPDSNKNWPAPSQGPDLGTALSLRCWVLLTLPWSNHLASAEGPLHLAAQTPRTALPTWLNAG